MKRLFILALGLVAGVFMATSCGNAGKTAASKDAISVIMSRKSVRSFTSQPVTDAQMETMLKAAMAAPTGHNVRPWSFVVLRDVKDVEAIFGTANHNLGIFKKAPAIVVFCADTTVVKKATKNPDTPMSLKPNGTWRDDMGACTENFLLAAEYLGLGAVWTASYPYPDRMDPVKKSLGLPAEVVPYCAVAVGYPDKENQPKDKWDPSRIHFGKW